MDRITRRELYLGVAKLMSARGTCGRAQVGCVITSIDHRIISTGYNGPITEDTCNTKCEDLDKPCEHAIHAEANAISAAAKHGIRLSGAILYCTHAPCKKCAELIIQAGITEVHFSNAYRIVDGCELLKKHGVTIIFQYE